LLVDGRRFPLRQALGGAKGLAGRRCWGALIRFMVPMHLRTERGLSVNRYCGLFPIKKAGKAAPNEAWDFG